jgi:predicted transcriptional regulator
VLRALAGDPVPAEGLVADLSASRSGVYKALDQLAARDLVAQSGEAEWELTDPGRLVVDELERHGWVEALLDERDYWLTHDLSGLPERFRRRLPELRTPDILRNPEGQPRYLERHWVEVMTDADRLWVGTRIVHEPYADAMDEQALAGPETRLIHHRPLFEEFVDREGVREAYVERRPDAIAERVCDLPCSFMLTDEVFTLSLPAHDGSYDRDTELVARGKPALRFGEEFFRFYWERATPVGAYLSA